MTSANLNRLASASASGSYGSQSYTYDGVGNRLTRVLGSTTENYAYSTTANQITTITSGGNTRTFSYAASGQVSQDVRDPSDTYTFAANDDGRNASAALNGTTAGAYLYNASEQRVQKTVGSTVTQFVFDRFGHLLAEANASGAAQKEYIWLDDVPVAVVDDSGASPVIYFIHTDQLGTPQKITDASATVIWDGVFDPFGNAQFTTSAGVWNTSTWNNFTWGADLSLTNLRFPGQSADAEVALNQNWFRDYDPTIGRYQQSDPIGLSGGINSYVYVGGNPIRAIDVAGLFNPAPLSYAARIALGEVVGGGGPEDPIGDVAAALTIAAGAVASALLPDPGTGGGGTTSGDGGRNCRCNPCIPPVGTIGYRFDRVPPSRPHWPFKGNHYKLSQMNQNPNNCRCFWKPLSTTEDPPPAGSVPISPARGGGFSSE